MTYQELINDVFSLNRIRPTSRSDKFDGYEIHHILPKCMGGKDNVDNLIYLTIAEHLRAHILLFRENPDNYKLAHAAKMMADTREDFRDLLLNIVDDEDEFNNCVDDIVAARAKCAEWRSENMSGENHPWFGRHHSEDAKRKNSEAHKGKHASNEARIKMSESQKNRWTDDVREEWSKKYSGEGNPRWGKHCSSDTKQKISKAIKCKYKGKDNHKSRSVICVDTGEIFINITEACIKTGITNISSCVRGKTKSAGGYKWMYLDKWNELTDEEKAIATDVQIGQIIGVGNPRNKAVICIETEDIFESIKIASEETGFSKSGICTCCKNTNKTFHGYHWMYYDEYLANKNDNSQLSL